MAKPIDPGSEASEGLLAGRTGIGLSATLDDCSICLELLHNGQPLVCQPACGKYHLERNLP